MLALRVSTKVANWLSNNIWFGLLVHNETLSFFQSVKRFLLNTVYEVVTCGNIVDEADDLAGGPDLNGC